MYNVPIPNFLAQNNPRWVDMVSYQGYPSFLLGGGLTPLQGMQLVYLKPLPKRQVIILSESESRIRSTFFQS